MDRTTPELTYLHTDGHEEGQRGVLVAAAAAALIAY